MFVPLSFARKSLLFVVFGILGTLCLLPQTALAAGEFITTWQTTSSSESITIPTTGAGYNYDVDWGDGSSDTGQTGDATHSYAATGTYTVLITGTFPRIFFNNAGDKDKIYSVEQWGTNPWTSMAEAFHGTSNLVVNATDTPDLSGVTSLSHMFAEATSFNQDISAWDVSHVTTMENLFYGATLFNQPLNSWDTSAVTSMFGVFCFASAFNQPLNMWHTSSVTDLTQTFFGASAFNQDISGWDVSHVTNLQSTFAAASTFNQPLNDWDVSQVTNMDSLFSNASAFNQPLDDWNTSHVTQLSAVFTSNPVFNQDISDWDVSHVTDMQLLFFGAHAFNQPLNDWDVSSVTNMSNMFSYAIAFDQPLDAWDVSHVTNMSNMFSAVTLSTANYDALLIGWSGLTLQPGVIFNGGDSLYSFAAETQRASIISTYGWTLYDAGLDPAILPPSPPPPEPSITPNRGGGSIGMIGVSPSALGEPGAQATPLRVAVNDSNALIVTSSERVVWLSFNADPRYVNGYALSLHPDFPQASINRYAPRLTYTLPAAYGEYTLYVKFFSTTGDPSNVIARSVSYAPAAAKKTTSNPSPVTTVKSILFRKSFGRGANSEDVRRLQAFLNAHGSPVTATGEGSIGKETTRFGEKTRLALVAYQKQVGIKPASGFFGPVTMNYINSALMR